jgi:hypothetical protein
MFERVTLDTELNIEPASNGFDYWLNRPFLTPEVRKGLASATVIIIPSEGTLRSEEPLFPRNTEELLLFLKNKDATGIVADIAINESDYRELSLNHNWVEIGTFLVTGLAFPVFVNLLSEYLNSKVSKKKEETGVSLEIVIENQLGEKIGIKYKGPISGFQSTLQPEILRLGQKSLSYEKKKKKRK